ncbi:hypothetical protein Lser_V15G18420 [Lactuca serriola]
MTRVDDISNATEDGKVQVHNEYPETSQQSTQPPSSEQIFVPEQQQGMTVHAQAAPSLPQIVIQPQFFIQPPVVYAPQPQPPPQPPVVYAPQPPPPPPQPPLVYAPQLPLPNRLGWTTGLFECMDDPENAIITLFCPCVTFGQLAATIDNGGTSCEMSGLIYTVVALVIGMPCIVSCNYRTKLRGRFGLMEEPASDCLTHLCCECCALCQEYRELNHRGFNPSAGKSIA